MERRNECVKMENPVQSTTSFMDYYSSMNNNNNSSTLTGLLDYSVDGEKSSFMELLNMQDFGPSIFDVLHGSVEPVPLIDQTELIQDQSSSKVLTTAPATPNCSSISSESNDDHHHNIKEQLLLDVDEEEEEEEAEQDEEEHHKTKKQLKTKKTISQKKRQREPRFAFMTKSEVDHLEDGYRWRKYGQKAVKNSPFPRSYYRCTSATCNVKKRVERSYNDPSVVVTTYEGQHTHPSPVMPRSGSAALQPYSGYSFPDQQMHLSPHNYQTNNLNYSLPLNRGFIGFPNAANYGTAGGAHQLRFCSPAVASSAAMLTDHGLLQDIVPWSNVKKEG